MDWNLVKLALIYIKRQPYPCIAYKENLIIGQHHSRKSWFFPMFTNPLPVRLYTKSKLENLINFENNKNILSRKYNGVTAAIGVGQQVEKNAQKFL